MERLDRIVMTNFFQTVKKDLKIMLFPKLVQNNIHHLEFLGGKALEKTL